MIIQERKEGKIVYRSDTYRYVKDNAGMTYFSIETSEPLRFELEETDVA